MSAYRRSLVLCVLLGALLAGCRDETHPTQPTAETARGSTAALVGAPNTWEQVAPMPSARFGAVAGSAVNANGRSILYVFGGGTLAEGQPGISTVENYNIVSNQWGTKADMLRGAGGINGVGNINGKLYLPGGIHFTGDDYIIRRSLQVYDPVANAWTLRADMPTASANGVVGVIQNRLYVLTGEDNTYGPDGRPCFQCPSVPTRELFRYNPQQNRWMRLKPAPRYHIGGYAAAINGKLYVAGGRGPTGSTRALDIYNPATNSWTSGAPLPNVHFEGVGVALGGQFYVIGGFTSEVVAYNPGTNRWMRKAPFPVASARFMSGDKVTLDGKPRIVVQVGLTNDGSVEDGRATFVYTP